MEGEVTKIAAGVLLDTESVKLLATALVMGIGSIGPALAIGLLA